MENMIVLPKLEKDVRLSRLIQEAHIDFEKAESLSIKGQYTHPKYQNDWVMAIRIEARELTNAGYRFLQGIYSERAVNRTVIIVHLCDLLKEDPEQGDDALEDFEQTVAKLRDFIENTYGWADVRPTSLLSVNRDGFTPPRSPELPEMRTVTMQQAVASDSTDEREKL